MKINDMCNTIYIHHLLKNSTVNGPGTRFVIWTQGCPLNCKGCFNQKTHSFIGGKNINIEKLATAINNTKNIRGITISGGEPLVQTEAISKLLQQINKKLDILLFSGYTFDEVKADKNKMFILHQVDAALLGRYNKNLPHSFYGKKLIIKGNRIKKEELKPWINTEIIFKEDDVSMTGLY